jgi:hypothetical protein
LLYKGRNFLGKNPKKLALLYFWYKKIKNEANIKASILKQWCMVGDKWRIFLENIGRTKIFQKYINLLATIFGVGGS